MGKSARKARRASQWLAAPPEWACHAVQFALELRRSAEIGLYSACALARKFQRIPVKARTALPFECPFIEVSNLDERAGNAESKLYRTG